MTSERVQASTQREHPTRRDIPTEGGDADAPLIREIQEPQVTALKRRVKFDWRPLDEALGYLVEIRLEDRRRVTAWGRSGHVELKTGSEPGRYLLVAREFEAGNGAGVLCTASYEQQGQIPGALPRSQILAAIGVAVAAVAGLLALGWSFLVAGDDADPWQWFVSSLGVAILLSLATSVIGFGLAAQPLTRPVDTRDAKLWSLNGSWLTNLAFIGLAVAAVVGKDGAFLSALSSDEKLVVVVSLIVFAAIAGSAGLIANWTHVVPTSRREIAGSRPEVSSQPPFLLCWQRTATSQWLHAWCMRSAIQL